VTSSEAPAVRARAPARAPARRAVASPGVTSRKIRVCFVCSGNICRSPTAEGVFNKLVADAGLADAFHVESAGTGSWHVGERPDPRTIRAAEARGYRLVGRAQHWKVRDFDRFDHVVAMDRGHQEALLRLATTEAMKAKISLALDHVPDGPRTRRGRDRGPPRSRRTRRSRDRARRRRAGLLAALRRDHAL